MFNEVKENMLVISKKIKKKINSNKLKIFFKNQVENLEPKKHTIQYQNEKKFNKLAY